MIYNKMFVDSFVDPVNKKKTIIVPEKVYHFIRQAVAYCRMTWVLNRIGLWTVIRR